MLAAIASTAARRVAERKFAALTQGKGVVRCMAAAQLAYRALQATTRNAKQVAMRILGIASNTKAAEYAICMVAH